MKKFFTLIIFFASIAAAFGQSADGRYYSIVSQDGTLVFCMPQRLKQLSGVSRIEYDVTLLTWTDSATINFTFQSPSMELPTSVAIIADADTLKSGSFAPLFVDIKKKRFEIRITSKFSNEEFASMINSVSPPRFVLTQGNEVLSATYQLGSWSKDRKKLLDIYRLYTLLK